MRTRQESIGEVASFLAPPLLIVGLALGGGGYGLADRHTAGIAVWIVVVVLVALGAASSARIARPFLFVAGSIAALALISAVSAEWSGSAERSIIEADRVLVYLGIFLAAFLIAQTERRRQRFAEGIAVAVALIALLALGSRLLPNVISVPDLTYGGSRLRYPLGYWNANAVMFGLALALLAWTGRRGESAAIRWFGVAVTPVAILALYFTYSRGGLLSALVAFGCLLALSRDRLLYLAGLLAALILTLPAIIATQSSPALAEGSINSSAVDQGVTVLLILIAAIVLNALAHWAILRAEHRNVRALARALELSRDPRLLRTLGTACAVLLIGAVAIFGGRVWERFSSDALTFPSEPQQRLTELSGLGRHDYWRVAIDDFADHPLLGRGAGTYEFNWQERRSLDVAVKDAHSVYLEAFDELGLIGGALTLALVLASLWWGFSAWRHDTEPARERTLVLVAVMLGFAVTAGFDWFWEIAGLGSLFFLAAGVAIGVRCAQPATATANATESERRHYGVAIGALALAWLSIAALVGPLLVAGKLSDSRAEAASGDIEAAISDASTARSVEPWAASPYVQLALLAELQGDYPEAITRLGQAIDREDRNWELFYLRARVEEESGDYTAAYEDLLRAVSLNPKSTTLKSKLSPNQSG